MREKYVYENDGVTRTKDGNDSVDRDPNVGRIPVLFLSAHTKPFNYLKKAICHKTLTKNYGCGGNDSCDYDQVRSDRDHSFSRYIMGLIIKGSELLINYIQCHHMKFY